MAELPISESQGRGDVARISAPDQIASLLRRIRDQRAVLNVTIPGLNNRFVSALLEVDLPRRELVMDELNPAHGHGALVRAGRCQVSATLNGVEMRFNCQLKNHGNDARLAFCRAELPQLIHYRQRRAYYRAHVSEDQRIPVGIEPRDGERLEGLLSDISVGGIGTHLELHYVLPLEQGTILPECVIELGPGETIANPIEVRFVGFEGFPRRLRLGGRFVNLSDALQRLIQRYVLTLEREWLKKRRR
jgi:c-di-GMP-binding flagellar brake protein YcgR